MTPGQVVVLHVAIMAAIMLVAAIAAFRVTDIDRAFGVLFGAAVLAIVVGAVGFTITVNMS